MSNFHRLKEVVAAQFANLQVKGGGELFVVDVSKDDIWKAATCTRRNYRCNKE